MVLNKSYVSNGFDRINLSSNCFKSYIHEDVTIQSTDIFRLAITEIEDPLAWVKVNLLTNSLNPLIFVPINFWMILPHLQLSNYVIKILQMV